MNELTHDQLQELIRVFREEMAQLTDELGRHLETLNSQTEADRSEIIEECMRLSHSIKGAACSVGYDQAESLAHAVEDSLAAFKSGDLPSDDVLGVAQRAVSVIQQLAEGQDVEETAQRLIQTLTSTVPSGTRGSRLPVPSHGKASQPSTPGEEMLAQLGTTSSVRVEASRLDLLMNYAGELLAAYEQRSVRRASTDRLFDLFQELFLGRGTPQWEEVTSFTRQFETLLDEERKELTSFGNLVSQITASVKDTRMIPLAKMTPFWHRVVREIGHEQGKNVRMTINVGEIELDRAIFDGLREPVMHLLRNAVDHGIEAPDERVQAGKPEQGKILIQAHLKQSMVRLEISDDGRGLDHDSIHSEARRMGLVDEAAPLGRSADVTPLLLRDGFSTRRRATRFSGRGVGLAVVRQRVEKWNGSVEIASSSPLGGASFVINFPVSILSAKGLLVTTEQQIYVLPVEYVLRTLRVDRIELCQFSNAKVVRLEDGTPLRLIWLSTIMGDTTNGSEKKLNVVIVKVDEVQIGLVVKNIQGEQEFVNKRLPWNLRSVPGVNGAVPLVDGTLAIVVDIPYLIQIASAQVVSTPSAFSPSGENRGRVLVVDDSLTARTVSQSTLIAAGYEVALAVNGEDAWRLLEREHIDLVVTDVQMPIMDGFELTRRIRAHQELKLLPVVLVTKRSSQEDVARGAESGADEYIVKGKLEQQKLRSAVTKLMRSDGKNSP